jgi:hypothetical protein
MRQLPLIANRRAVLSLRNRVSVLVLVTVFSAACMATDSSEDAEPGNALGSPAQAEGDSMQSPPPPLAIPTQQSGLPASDSLLAFITQRYTRRDSSSVGDFLFPVNRFAELAEYKHRKVNWSDCWLFTLDDGVFCFEHREDNTLRAHTIWPKEHPVEGLRLAVKALGDTYEADGSLLAVTELLTSDRGLSCSSFFSRRHHKLSSEVTLDDAYRLQHTFTSGFSCESHDVTTWYWQQSEASYSTETFISIWDVFEWNGVVNVLLLNDGCSGECQSFEIREFVSGESLSIGSVFLWRL